MIDLFMCLLLNLVRHGKITEAHMYGNGTFSNMTIKTDKGSYKVSISKENDEAEKTTDGNI